RQPALQALIFPEGFSGPAAGPTQRRARPFSPPPPARWTRTRPWRTIRPNTRWSRRMPHRSLPLLSLLLLAWLSPSVLRADTLPLIPRPVQVERHDGVFRLSGATPLRVAADDTAARQAASFLVQSL